MQDLVISRSVTIRQVSGVTYNSDTTILTIPPNPDRVTLYCFGENGDIIPVKMQADASGQLLNGVRDADAGVNYLAARVSISDYPGIFNGPLYAFSASSANRLLEAVMDPALASVVNKGYGQLLVDGG
jgi:hypothetical protein